MRSNTTPRSAARFTANVSLQSSNTRSSQCPYLKALLRAIQIKCRTEDATTPSRPSAPEGGAQGRAPILPGRSRCRSWLSSLLSFCAAGCRVPVSSEPYLRRQRGLRVSRRDVAIRCRASRAHGHSARVPPGTTPGGPPGRGSGSRLVRIQEGASATWRATAPTAVACPFRCRMRA
jgi:hypothetical protein